MADFIETYNWGWVVREGDIEGLAAVLQSARKRLSSEQPHPPLQPPPLWQDQSEHLLMAYENLLCTA